MHLETRGGLVIGLERDGSVREVRLAGRKIGRPGQGGFAIDECLLPSGRCCDLGRVIGRTRRLGGGVHFDGAIEPAALELSADLTGGRFIDVRGEVRDLSGADRALKVSFTLPVNLAGWRWENTAGAGRNIQPAQAYPSRPGEFLYLGKKGDGFANEDHRHYDIRINKLPFTAVSKGEVGLAVAYPVHEPRVFLLTADSEGLKITFSLGVTAATRRFPSRASFRFIIFPIDGRWGIRSACENYQAFFPELFKSRCARHGNNATIYNPDNRPPQEHLADMGYAFLDNDFQWTNWELPEASLRLARSIGIGPEDIAHWRGPWYWFHEAPGDITRDAQLALLKAQAEGRKSGAHGQNNQLCGCPNELSAKGAFNSYVEDHEGKLERTYFAYPSYSCWLLPMNMDPNLPAPSRASLANDWQFRLTKLWKRKGYRGPFSVAWDAFDDFGGFRKLNFRREHFAVSELPLTFDPVSGRLCQVNGFSSCLWARQHSRLVHRAGGKVLSNVNLEQSMMFGGQYIDFIERERRPRDYDEERLSTHRMLLGGKPIAFCGGGWVPKTRRGWLSAARKLLAFGIAPGPREDRWRELRDHMPLLRRVAEAGWQPVPYAIAKGLWIERFGQSPGELCFTLRNRGGKTVKTALCIDLPALGLGKSGLIARSILPASSQTYRIDATGKLPPIAVAPHETVVLAVERAPSDDC
jgi:hypothetical protein